MKVKTYTKESTTKQIGFNVTYHETTETIELTIPFFYRTYGFIITFGGEI